MCVTEVSAHAVGDLAAPRCALRMAAIMFKKLLVANRGEIAIRVMRACREMDIASVGVYSDLDAEAPHARYADEAYNVGAGPAAASYLNVDAILGAAARAG